MGGGHCDASVLCMAAKFCTRMRFDFKCMHASHGYSMYLVYVNVCIESFVFAYLYRDPTDSTQTEM